MIFPVWLRLIIYFLTAAGLAFVQMSEGMNEGMDRFQWIRFGVAVFLQGALAVKAYIDSSFTRAADQKKEEVKQDKIDEKQNEKLTPTPTVLP